MKLLILLCFLVPSCILALGTFGYLVYKSLTSNQSTSRTNQEDDRRATEAAVVTNPSEATDRPSKEDDPDKIMDYNGLTENAREVTFTQLNQTIGIVKSTNIQGLEQKIYAFLHRGDDKIFKNYDQSPKRGFRDWDSICNQMQKFNELKILAAEVGVLISRAIVNIMFLMSLEKGKEPWAKIRAIQETLTLVRTGEITLVVPKILDLLQEAEVQVKRRKDSMKAELAILDVVHGRLRFLEKFDVSDGLGSSFLDKILFKLLKYIFQLELFLVCRRLPHAEVLLLAELPSLEIVIAALGLSLKRLDIDISSSMQEDKFGTINRNWNQNDYYQATESKINELWQGLESDLS